MDCSVSQSDIYGTIQSSVGDLSLAECVINHGQKIIIVAVKITPNKELDDIIENDAPSSADGESRPLEPPSLLPDIGESHPCPYFVGRDLNFLKPREAREPKKKEVCECVPIIVPPPTIPLVPKVAEPLIEKLPARSVTPESEVIAINMGLEVILTERDYGKLSDI
ncbi:uncharacterized protein TNIN_45421 [Trichonephila inaurata madagascariensis]|uniref:Uncharacterized protein n=1 Tax=Trichonephila inaurata madagascariensis TaxID=2747483 RepID=A0A8X6WN98_9ARAC|nr:uncharacterized protein TNIN_45421 [Trichonephila inaurata madagascariensis]